MTNWQGCNKDKGTIELHLQQVLFGMDNWIWPRFHIVANGLANIKYQTCLILISKHYGFLRILWKIGRKGFQSISGSLSSSAKLQLLRTGFEKKVWEFVFNQVAMSFISDVWKYSSSNISLHLKSKTIIINL